MFFVSRCSRRHSPGREACAPAILTLPYAGAGGFPLPKRSGASAIALVPVPSRFRVCADGNHGTGRMSRFWSDVVHGLQPYVPGEQPRMADLVKLNTNESPFGPSPRVLDAVRPEAADSLRLYPDPTAM